MISNNLRTMKITLRTYITSLVAALAIGATFSAFAGQPHMEAAISHLEAAKAELQAAESNKGGWRVEAIKTIDLVIGQVRNGEGAAKKNR